MSDHSCVADRPVATTGTRRLVIVRETGRAEGGTTPDWGSPAQVFDGESERPFGLFRQLRVKGGQGVWLSTRDGKTKTKRRGEFPEESWKPRKNGGTVHPSVVHVVFGEASARRHPPRYADSTILGVHVDAEVHVYDHPSWLANWSTVSGIIASVCTYCLRAGKGARYPFTSVERCVNGLVGWLLSRRLSEQGHWWLCVGRSMHWGFHLHVSRIDGNVVGFRSGSLLGVRSRCRCRWADGRRRS